MKPLRYTLSLILLLCFTSTLFAQQLTKGKNFAPAPINKKFYKWKGGSLEPNQTGSDPVDIWYSQYTEPMNGFVVLKSGERIDGNIEVHWRYNKASTMTRTVDGKSVPIPGGKKGTEGVNITTEEGSKYYTLYELKSYGPYFKMDDWAPSTNEDPAYKFLDGMITLKDGTVLKGTWRTIYHSTPYDGLKYYYRVYLSQGQDEYVQTFLSREVEEAIQVDNGREIRYTSINDYMIKPHRFIQKLEKNAKKMGFEEPASGSVNLNGKGTENGKVAFNTGKSKKEIFFYNAEDMNIRYYEASEAEDLITFEGSTKGVSNIYFPYKDKFQVLDDQIADWKKKGEYHSGTIYLLDGTQREGKLVHLRVANAVKSYRFTYGFLLVKSGGLVVLERYDENDIDYVICWEEGKSNRYASVDRYFYDTRELVAKMEKLSNKDPLKNLQKGYVMMVDGTKKEGRLHKKGRKSLTLVSGQNIDTYRSNDPSLDYFVLLIDGLERQFRGMEYGQRAFEGPGSEWVEIMNPFRKYSYFSNPNPTNLKKQTTKLVRTGLNAGAKQLDGMDVGEGGIYHDEWIIVNNETGEEVVIFKENDKQVADQLLSTCSNYSAMTDNEKRKLRNVDNIQYLVGFLNQSCQ